MDSVLNCEDYSPEQPESSIEAAPERRRDNTSISHLLIEEMKDVNSPSVKSARGSFESCLFKSKEDSPDIVNRRVKSR